ncbi:hypothetical protein VNO80_23535 [Phaseolus coccineus]|uniref:Uncharacterized protein n=1 Tax=Phaseolus coccineus TaxID=3886 RepID=A0AAN9QV77_PHACN
MFLRLSFPLIELGFLKAYGFKDEDELQLQQACVSKVLGMGGSRRMKRFKFYVAYPPTMFFSGGKRLLQLSLVVLLGVTVVQMWVCWHSCQVGAIRVFPSHAMAKVKFSHGIEGDEKVKEDLLQKHFSGSTFGLISNGTHNRFDENMRRVPSCPDPLHN